MPKNHSAAGARLPMKLSQQWVKEIPTGATALIVAELFEKTRTTPLRRIALDWLYGERKDTKALHTAAAKLPNTAVLAEAGQEVERQESDGSCSLSSSERCQVRWVVRSIPVGIITCWTGFEDGINPPVQAMPTQSESVPVTPDPKPAAPIQATARAAAPVLPPNPVVQTEPQIQPAQHRPAQRSTSRSTEPSRTGAQYSTDTTPPPYPAPLPVFAPLSALILDKKKALLGNSAAPDGKFITDGRMLLVRSACEAKFVEKLKPVKCNNYGPENPVPEGQCKKLLDTAVQDARYDATICGYVLGASVDLHDVPEQPLVCLRGPGESISIVDGHRLLLAQNITGANHVKVSAELKPRMVVLFKDDAPVALLMSIDYPQVVATFEKMLDAPSRGNITSITPAVTRRAS